MEQLDGTGLPDIFVMDWEPSVTLMPVVEIHTVFQKQGLPELLLPLDLCRGECALDEECPTSDLRRDNIAAMHASLELAMQELAGTGPTCRTMTDHGA